MELLGLIWAASLPHQNAAINLSQALIPPEEHSSADHQRGQQNPIPLDLNLSYQGRLHVPLVLPLGFQPQLQLPDGPKVDWDHWELTAIVTVVPNDLPLNPSSVKTASKPKSSPIDTRKLACPAHGEEIVPQLGQAAMAAEPGAYSIRVNRQVIGTLPSQSAAEKVARQLRRALAAVEANPAKLEPKLTDSGAVAQVEDQTIFELTNDLVTGNSAKSALMVTAWVNNLRHVFDASPLALSETQMVLQGLGETHQVISGTASWYGPYFHGRQTATGELFNQHELTAAHKTLPFGTQLKVRNLLNDKTVVVRINDRGPYIGDRSLDLSYAAAQCLDSETVGVIPYEATILQPGLPEAWKAKSLVARK